MAIRDTASLRAWASASPEELEALKTDDALYKQDDIADAALADGEEPGDPNDPDFDPEEIEAYAYDLSDQLNNGEGDDELVALVDDYDPADGIPRWVGDVELWEGAIDLAQDVEQETAPTYWQLVAHLYQYMQGPILEPEVSSEEVTVVTPGDELEEVGEPEAAELEEEEV